MLGFAMRFANRVVPGRAEKYGEICGARAVTVLWLAAQATPETADALRSVDASSWGGISASNSGSNDSVGVNRPGGPHRAGPSGQARRPGRREAPCLLVRTRRRRYGNSEGRPAPGRLRTREHRGRTGGHGVRISLSPRIAVLPHLLRLTPALQMSVLGGLALVLCAVPFTLSLHPLPADAATLLRVAAVPCTIAVAFALDDPAARITATVPLPLLWRRLLRLTLTLAPLAAVWTVCGLLLRAARNPPSASDCRCRAWQLRPRRWRWARPCWPRPDSAPAGERSSGLAAPAGVLLPLILVVTPFRSDPLPHAPHRRLGRHSLHMGAGPGRPGRCHGRTSP